MLTAVGKAVSTVEETVTLDNGGFTALELNSRPIHVKSVFLRKNGTRYCKEGTQLPFVSSDKSEGAKSLD